MGKKQRAILATAVTVAIAAAAIGTPAPPANALSEVFLPPAIAFVSSRDTGVSRLFTMDENGAREMQVVPQRAGFSPDIAPDGQRVAYTATPLSPSAPQGQRLIVANLDGSCTHADVLPPGQGGFQPQFSPDGTQIAYVRVSMPAEGGNSVPELWVMDANGSNHRRVTGLHADTPAWSPDGKRLVFVTRIGAESQLATADVDGTDIRIITSHISSEYAPHWSPDGRRIVYSGEGGNNGRAIWLVDADGGNERVLVPATAADAHADPEWSPDGTRVVFASSGGGEGGLPEGIFTVNPDPANLQVRHLSDQGMMPTWIPQVDRDDAGYRFAAGDGGVFNFGAACFFGSLGGMPLAKPIVGTASTPHGRGYWLIGSDGGVFSFGDATFYGSTGGIPLNRPIVGMAATSTGLGYWLVASDGGIFAFGDATFYGSTGGLPLNKPIVGMAATWTGRGYWLVASDGGAFAFGDARFEGSTGGVPLNKPIIGMARAPQFGSGYWLVASDGGVFAFGSARYEGSTGGVPLNQPIVGIVGLTAASGYRLIAADGGVFTFGGAGYFGSTGALRLVSPITGASAG